MDRGALHHVELWVADLEASTRSLGWLLEELGWTAYQSWAAGRSWRLGGVYVVMEQSPAMVAGEHERTRAGLNHLALHAGTPRQLDELTGRALQHGWSLMYADRHPHAGGPEHYAAYLEDEQGFEVELVAEAAAPPALPESASGLVASG